MTDYCRHDLPLGTCSVCRPQPFRDDLEPMRDTTPHAPATVALYDSICPACEGDIVLGDPIRLDVAEHAWVHEECL